MTKVQKTFEKSAFIVFVCIIVSQEYLLKLGNVHRSPVDFLNQENSADSGFLVIIKNKDIAGHIHKVFTTFFTCFHNASQVTLFLTAVSDV